VSASLICFESETQYYDLTSKGAGVFSGLQGYSKRNRQAEKLFCKVNSIKQTLEKLINQ
jgi:hypothetical protein